MTSFRIAVTVLAVLHAVFAGFTALVGAFANGGDVWQRLLVILLHPLGAAGVLLLVLRPRLATTTILAGISRDLPGCDPQLQRNTHLVGPTTYTDRATALGRARGPRSEIRLAWAGVPGASTPDHETRLAR